MYFKNSKMISEENFVVGLSNLYESFGYKKFKMRKFEKYDLYLENKSFLRNANIITVTDPTGRLLALKPDITLSIVKNVRASNLPQKFYYNENIYVADSNAGEIKEMTQVGLEYIGDLDIRAMGEILLLSAESLGKADDNYRIAVSHMGIVSDFLNFAKISEVHKQSLYELISQKNLHGINEICKSLNISQECTTRICKLASISGELSEAIAETEALVDSEAAIKSIQELYELSDIINAFGLSDKFILDFSVMNDVSYYNGLMFQGFINGIPKAVLSGGRYDNLVRRFGCETSAAGFAVSVDLLNKYYYSEPEYDYDVLLLYSGECNPTNILKEQKNINGCNESCIALSSEPEWIKYKRKIIMNPDGSLEQ